MSAKAPALAPLLLLLALSATAAAAGADGWFGFSLAVEIGGTAAAPRVESAWVVKVVPGSPAEKRGVEAGDVLVEVDGAAVAGAAPDDLKARIAKPVGGRLRLALRRGGGASRTVELVAAARPPDAPR